jgi:hypothetical protein
MRRALLGGATLALAAGLLPEPAPAQDAALLPPAFLGDLKAPVAACVLDRLGTALTETAVVLLVQSCTRLVASAAGDAGNGAGDSQLFVRCKVAGDPEWLEFRLVTRGQCAAAAGQVQD